MRLSAAFEKRDWGSGLRTWRPVPAVMQRKRRGLGPSQFCVRRLTNRIAKRRLFQ